MAVTFGQARQAVLEDWPDYQIADFGFEDDEHWFLILLPVTTGGRIPAVAKATGDIMWINENAEMYTQERPVGPEPGLFASAVLAPPLWAFHLPGKHDQSSHGKGGKGVKTVSKAGGLGKARNIGELNVAAAAEFKKITGRDVKVDMKGSDLKVAREHLEGVLEAQSKYPGVRVDRVVTYGPGGALPSSRFSRESFAESGYALTEPTIGFNAAYSSHPAIYRSDLEAGRRAGFEVFDNPRGVAIHEFGHQLEQQTASASASRRVAVASARRAGEKPTAHIDSQISTYATTNDSELSAEAFADVMLNGGSASPTSQAIFDALDTRYNAYGLGE